MKIMTKTLLVAALSLTTLTLAAQSDERPGRPEGRGHRVPPMIAALDANHDGVIDSAELAKASSVLATLDKNSDGQLTADELRPAGPEGGKPPGGGGPEGRPEGRPGGKGHGVPPFAAALDANHDGVIDASEIANATAALTALDANKDGQLTQDELRPAKREGEGDRGQGPRGKRGPRPEVPAGQ